MVTPDGRERMRKRHEIVVRIMEANSRALRQEFIIEISSSNLCGLESCRAASCSKEDGAIHSLFRM